MQKTPPFLSLLLAFCLLLLPTGLMAAEKPIGPAPTLILGHDNAPVVLDDYSSLGCSHCANFHLNTLPQVKALWVQSGKLKIVYHHFPLDKASVDAALLVHCAKPADAWGVMDLLFREQANWTRDPKYRDKLVGYGQMVGLTEKTVKSCLSDEAMRNRILQGRVDANKALQIKATPTLVFNKGAARLEGDQTPEAISAVVSKF